MASITEEDVTGMFDVAEDCKELCLVLLDNTVDGTIWEVNVDEMLPRPEPVPVEARFTDDPELENPEEDEGATIWEGEEEEGTIPSPISRSSLMLIKYTYRW